jgi:hypothetical protein
VEAATGLVLMVDPSMVATWLIGAEVSGVGIVLGRCFGVSLVALGTACWPGGARVGSGSPAFRGMLAYNVGIALYLAYVGAAEHLGGPLLWPGVVLHAVVAALLFSTRA